MSILAETKAVLLKVGYIDQSSTGLIISYLNTTFREKFKFSILNSYFSQMNISCFVLAMAKSDV